MEQEVATVFELKDRVGVAEGAPLLLVNAQSETQACRIDPPLAHLVQPPYRPFVGQGVCDACQACGVGDVSETIPLLAEVEARLGRPAGDVLVAVEDDLRAERRM